MHSMHEVVPSAVSAAVMMLASTWRTTLHPSLFFIVYLLSHLVLTCGLGEKVVRFESILFDLRSSLLTLGRAQASLALLSLTRSLPLSTFL